MKATLSKHNIIVIYSMQNKKLKILYIKQVGSIQITKN
jgi:hypothetical protein